MTATPDQINFATRANRIVRAESTAVLEASGSRARRTEDPVQTLLDNVDDAQVVADERLELQSQSRRSSTLTVVGLDEFIDFPTGDTSRFIDEQSGTDRAMLIAQVELDFGSQSAELTLWG